MTRAEQAALKAYPVHSVLVRPARQGGYYADNHLRSGFIKGYDQAEKDLKAELLEWANKAKEDALRIQNGKFYGLANAFQALIDKLNTL